MKTRLPGRRCKIKPAKTRRKPKRKQATSVKRGVEKPVPHGLYRVENGQFANMDHLLG